MRILLTGAGGSAASNYLDALRMEFSDLYVLGVDVSPYMLMLSKVDDRRLIPRANEKNFIKALNKLVEDFQIDVLHSQPDPEVYVIGAKRSELLLPTFLPSQNALEVARDKEVFASTLRSKNIAIPISGAGESKAEFSDMVSRLLKEFPKLWVRARTGAGSRASLPVSETNQAINWIEWWISEKGLSWSDFMASEFLPGKEYALQTVWQDGTLISAEARERVAYLYGFLSPSGQSSTPSIARSTRDARVYDIGLDGIRALDSNPNGVYCADIKEGYSGELKITEVNAGRFFTTSNFFAHAGVNMPAMAVKAALGEKLVPLGVGTIPENQYWIRMVDMGYRLVTESELRSVYSV